jgi:DNA-binding NarL/FixJ family response regulator
MDNSFIKLTQSGADFREPPEITVIDEKRWALIGKRYNMTQRELDVAKLVCRGFDNRYIAGTLSIKEGTVKTHIRNIYRRLNVQNRIAMFLKFIRFAAQLVGDEGHKTVSPAIVEYLSDGQMICRSEAVK